MALQVFAKHPCFTANYLQYNYGVHRDAFTAFGKGEVIPDCYFKRIVKAIFDDTPDDSVDLCALLRDLTDTQWEE